METGYFGLHVASQDYLKDLKVTITGYPSSYPSGEKKKSDEYQMWEMDGKILGNTENFISYQSYTIGGNSGGGVWSKEGEDYYVYGVHALRDIRGVICKGAPLATRLTKTSYEDLKKQAAVFVLKKVNEVEQRRLIEQLNPLVKKLKARSVAWGTEARTDCIKIASQIQNLINDQQSFGASSILKQLLTLAPKANWCKSNCGCWYPIHDYRNDCKRIVGQLRMEMLVVARNVAQ